MPVTRARENRNYYKLKRENYEQTKWKHVCFCNAYE